MRASSAARGKAAPKSDMKLDCSPGTVEDEDADKSEKQNDQIVPLNMRSGGNSYP